MSSFYDRKLSKSKCGALKGFSTEQYLLALFKNCERAIDSGEVFDAIRTDLLIVLDCLDHELLIAGLNVFGFSSFFGSN